MNLVERWFGHLDNKAIRRGVFLSVADLQASISAFLDAWNQNPRPFGMDRDGRIHSGEAQPLSPHIGANPTRLHESKI